MGTDAYREGIFQAWQGELWGKAFFERLAVATDDSDEQAKWQVLAELEEVTGNRIAPLVADTTHPPLASSHRSLDSALELYEALPWREAMERMMGILDPAIERFRDLLAQAPAAERDAVQILVDHEIALKLFAEREIAGDGVSSLDPVRAVINRAR
ncbi:MAG: hypothetical protein OXG25_08255 [Gammaproteobacteria bacterium]|nr:hypothetical protein [Gammaproteobacteria bacterium]